MASFADKNVGTGKPVSITGVNVTGPQADNYRLITTTGSTSASITRLNSVTWVGGATGDWFDPANWAVTGDPAQTGAVPDLANVAHVVIPNGHTVNYSTAAVVPAVASSPVEIDGLSGGGGLAQDGGQLIVGAGGVTIGSLNQSMGSLTVAGSLSVNRSYNQSGSGTVQISGATAISAVSGAVQLGNLTSAGALTVASTDGVITQADNTVLAAGSNSSLMASTGGIPAQAADIILTSVGNDFAGLVTANGRDVKINSQNTLNLDAMATADLRVQAGGALTIQGQALNLHSASVANTTFGPVRVAQHLSAQSTSGSLLQTAPLRVDGKSELNAAVSIDLPHIDNQLVNGVQALAPRVSIVGDRVAQTSAAAAAAATAAAGAAAAKVDQSAPFATGADTSSGLTLTVEPVSRIRVQAQGSGMVIASGSAVVSSASVVKAGVELALNPAAAPTAAPVATGSVVVTDAAFVQVKSFEPLPVPSGSSFSFSLPGDAFVHKDPKMAVSVSAQTPTGDKLPDWLSFAPAERRFTGVAPQGVSQIEVMVKAVDASGVEATTVITLQFNAPAQ